MSEYIGGLSKLLHTMKEKARRIVRNNPTVSLRIGYTAFYALRVHEDLMMNHPNGGEAKFLEKAIRRNNAEITDIVSREIRNGQSLSEALFKAGEMIVAESTKLVPVDTGYLRDSWYIQIERS